MRYEWQVSINNGKPMKFSNQFKAIDEFRFHERQIGVRIKTLELRRVTLEDPNETEGK